MGNDREPKTETPAALSDAELGDALQAVKPKLVERMFGLAAKSRNDWEMDFQVPIGTGRRGINLFDVGASIRRLISDNYRVLKNDELAQAKLEAEKQKSERWKRQNLELELRLRQQRGELVDVAEVQEAFNILRQTFTKASQQIQKRFGDEAYEIIHDAVTVADDYFLSVMNNTVVDE